MQLGDLLHGLQNEGSAAEALEAIGDLVLFARVAENARGYDETPGAYVAAGVGRFAASASDEAWLGLLSALGRESDPGQAALKRILAWVLEEDQACGDGLQNSECGAGGGCCHRPP